MKIKTFIQQYFIFFVVLMNITSKKIKQMLSITKSNLIILVFLFSSYFSGYSQINKQNVKNGLEIKNPSVISEEIAESFLSHVHRDIRKGNLPYYLDNSIIKNNSIPSFKIENSVVRELI
ncbi:MAG: hypothetical protein IPH32_09350 [Bacteroidetes bacterium]|nr:hypothetical protein [Bacteroidota bacterium]